MLLFYYCVEYSLLKLHAEHFIQLIFFFGLQLSGHYVLSIVVMSMGYALAVAIQAVAACGNKNDSCGTNPDTQLALHIVILCVIVVGNFLGITSMVFHMRNRKILHPEWKNRKGCCC